jgi:hypothetical protein
MTQATNEQIQAAISLFERLCCKVAATWNKEDGDFEKMFPELETIRSCLNDALWNFDMDAAPKDEKLLVIFETEDGEHREVCEARYWEKLEDGPDYMGHDAGWMDAECQWNLPRTFGNEIYIRKHVFAKAWRHLPAVPAVQENA